MPTMQFPLTSICILLLAAATNGQAHDAHNFTISAYVPNGGINYCGFPENHQYRDGKALEIKQWFDVKDQECRNFPDFRVFNYSIVSTQTPPKPDVNCTIDIYSEANCEGKSVFAIQDAHKPNSSDDTCWDWLSSFGESTGRSISLWCESDAERADKEIAKAKWAADMARMMASPQKEPLLRFPLRKRA